MSHSFQEESGNSSGSAAERLSGKLLVTQFLSFFILLLLWKFQCTLELSWQRSNSTEDSPSVWIAEFLGEAALHNPFLLSPACGGCLPPDKPNDKDDPVAVKWGLEKLCWWCCATVSCLAFSPNGQWLHRVRCAALGLEEMITLA